MLNESQGVWLCNVSHNFVWVTMCVVVQHESQCNMSYNDCGTTL